MEVRIKLDDIQKFSLNEIEQLLQDQEKTVTVLLENNDYVQFCHDELVSLSISKPIAGIQVKYYFVNEEEQEHILLNRGNFPVDGFKSAFRLFLSLLVDPSCKNKHEEDFTNWEIHAINKKSCLVGSHYRYLEAVIDQVFFKIFPLSNDSYKGAIAAHGDKSRQYFVELEEAGINKYHASLMHLLTYFIELDRPRHELVSWIIENYPKYKDLFNKVDLATFEKLKSRLS